MTSPPSGVADAAGSQGQDTVAASTVCQVSPTRCQACTRLYRGGRLELEGFPVADGPNDAIIGPSVTLGADLRAAFASGTGEPISSYDGTDGIQPRDDLAGINLSRVPKVFIECANMRNATDAALVTSPRWQATAARAIAAGLTAFLTGAG